MCLDITILKERQIGTRPTDQSLGSTVIALDINLAGTEENCSEVPIRSGRNKSSGTEALGTEIPGAERNAVHRLSG